MTRQALLLFAGVLLVTACTVQRQVEILPANALPVAPKHAPTTKTAAAATTMQQMRNMVYFLSDSEEITSQSRDVLLAKAKSLATLPGETLIIEGHCDERGASAYNKHLGERRAMAVREFLLEHGVDGSWMLVVSYGKEQPIDPGHDEDAWALNRRCEFRLKP